MTEGTDLEMLYRMAGKPSEPEPDRQEGTDAAMAELMETAKQAGFETMPPQLLLGELRLMGKGPSDALLQAESAMAVQRAEGQVFHHLQQAAVEFVGMARSQGAADAFGERVRRLCLEVNERAPEVCCDLIDVHVDCCNH